MGFPGSSAGKESTYNVGDSSSIPGLGRSPGEGIGYPLQYSWAPLVAQMVKRLPVMWETQVRSLGWADPLEKEMAIHSSIPAWRIPLSEAPGSYSPWGGKELDTTKHSIAHSSTLDLKEKVFILALSPLRFPSAPQEWILLPKNGGVMHPVLGQSLHLGPRFHLQDAGDESLLPFCLS